LGNEQPAGEGSLFRQLIARLRDLPVSRSLAIRIALSLALAIVSYKTNRSFLIWGLFVIFALLVVPKGRGRSFIFSFVPYAALWFVFTAARSLADETVLARTLNTKVPQLERWLFSGQLPTIMLQDRLFDRNHLHWYDYFSTGVHWSYFLIPHAVVIRLWYRDPAYFRRYLSTMTLLLANGLCIYFLIPSNPPWLAPEAINSPAAPTPYRIMATVGKQLGGGVYEASYRVVGESNPLAAMPSIHMAITILLVFPAFRAGKWWGIAALAYNVMMGFSLVYLGEHYVVDILAGCAITAYAWFAAGTWLRKVAPAMSHRFSPTATAQPTTEIVSNPT
jgi:membrane-associated phospholipid phosphatase